YIDRTKFYKVREINDSLPYVQLQGKITRLSKSGEKRSERLVAEFSDETGSIELIWFKGIKWIAGAVELNKEYIIFGKPTRFKSRYNIVHPEFEPAAEYQKNFFSSLQAVYPATERLTSSGLGSKAIWKLQITLFR